VNITFTRKARCPQCGGQEIRDTGFRHNDERTLECMDPHCGSMFEESDG
jgi:hypothetical protein